MTQGPQGTQAIMRAVSLLKAFTLDRPRLSVPELTELLVLKPATVRRIVNALVSEGLLSRAAAGMYRLGPASIALGHQALLASDLRQKVRATLLDLHAFCGETITLEVLMGDQTFVLDGVPGRHLVSANLDLSTRWPAHLTSTGRAILARLAPANRMRLMATLTETEQEQLDDVLTATQVRGYAQVIEELEPDYVGVAAAFGDHPDEPLGALCIGGPVSRFTKERRDVYGKRVAEAARELDGHLSEG